MAEREFQVDSPWSPESDAGLHLPEIMTRTEREGRCLNQAAQAPPHRRIFNWGPGLDSVSAFLRL